MVVATLAAGCGANRKQPGPGAGGIDGAPSAGDGGSGGGGGGGGGGAAGASPGGRGGGGADAGMGGGAGAGTGGGGAAGGASGAGGSGGSGGSGGGAGRGGASGNGGGGNGGGGNGGGGNGGGGRDGAAGAGGAPDGGADRPPASGALPWPEANAIVDAVVAAMPRFPARNCPVTDAAFGGRGDGTTDNTEAFKKAIATCAQAGGGHVVVPAGNYLTGAIELLDNIDLHLEMGATLLFSGDGSKFPVVLTRYEGIELMNRSPMIYAYKRRNIALTGSGVLDASRTAAWNTGGGRGRLEGWANSNTPVAQRVGNQSRTSFVQPYACTNVLIQGITLRGARFWQLHPVLSSYVLIDGVTTTDSGAGNNDGFDPESSDHVVLRNSTIKAGDDAIAVKSGRDADGRRINTPTRNLVIMHSSFASRWGMLTLGSELTGGIENVYGYDLRTIPGDTVKYVLELKGNSQRGGFINGVFLDKISATRGVTAAVMWADMQYMGQTGPYLPKYDRMSIGHAIIDGAPYVLDLQGMSAANPLGAITVHDSVFTSIANPGNRLQYVRSVTWDRVTINGMPVR